MIEQDARTLLTARPYGMDPVPTLAWLADQQPVVEVPMGQRTAWLVTGYAEVRQVLSDPRFGVSPLREWTSARWACRRSSPRPVA
ncbi:hypothetical protein GCM10012275_57130 [Longimycelium tulufanense]|uniref:Cytochrome P450 n=1 Tax=Longimycelium tulufanense TaxID=907463 RepID=A0A8J3FZC4_9PSEU|nr:hypothetical protein [Longimycelium tulufanense]GGM79104.1 hypothetical protein GCM10012275_57130 [Longimycelium tulufanense]